MKALLFMLTGHKGSASCHDHGGLHTPTIAPEYCVLQSWAVCCCHACVLTIYMFVLSITCKSIQAYMSLTFIPQHCGLVYHTAIETICMFPTNVSIHTLFPTMQTLFCSVHKCVCQECADQLWSRGRRQCPVCRQPVERILSIY